MTFRVGGPLAMPANRKQLGIIGTLAAALAMSTAIPALAQDAGVTALEGIVVTGEKVDRDYLDTFTSVGVATKDDIENYQLNDLFDTFNTMANVRNFGANGGNSTFQIRGVNADGVAISTNSQPTISVIIDGAVQSAEGTKRGSRGTWDMKQVEVLRGPQSGLYGRSALAGAVVVESNDPTFTPEMEAKGVLADQERREGALMFSGPIIDNQVAFRVSAEIREHTKDITVIQPADAELMEDSYRNVRGKLLIKPEAVPGLSALFTVNHVFDQPGANSVTRGVGYDFFDRIYDSGFGSDGVELRAGTVNNYISNISYGLAEGYTLRSVSAYVDTDIEITNAPGSPLYFRDDLRDGEDFTQDLRLEITDEAKTGLSGVVGVSYGRFKNDSDTNLGLAFIPPLPPGFPAPAEPPFLVQDGVFSSDTESQAIYADLRYKVYGGWSLIGGLRYQNDIVTNSGDIDYYAGLVPFSYDEEAEFHVLLPKYGLAYEIDTTQTVAATASRGYRAGFAEINPTLFEEGNPGAPILFPPPPAPTVDTIDPEFVWSYELAYRKTTEDKRLTLGVNLFYNVYEDQQISVADPNSFYDITFNVDRSVSYGAEVEGRYNFGNGLSVFGAVGLLKTEFEKFDNLTLCPSGQCTGNEFPESPNLTFSFGGMYKHESGFFGSAHVNYTGSYYTRGDINNEARFELDSYLLVNAKLGYTYDNMTIAVFADNLLDEDYLTAVATRASGDPTQATIGDSRIVGVEVRAKF